MPAELAKELHARYFRRCLDMLPSAMAPMEASRMTLVQLCLVGLSVLGELEAYIPEKERQEMIEWIYDQQVPRNESGSNAAYCGFRGGSLFGPHSACEYLPANCANLAATYSALCSLLLLGDDLSRVDREAIVGAMPYLQQESGLFAPHPDTTEHDPRFMYCACAISKILGDWSGVDREAAVKHIQRCVSFDGGITQAPFQESHGGHLYCCVASLALMDRLDAIPDKQRTLQWALLRQCGGYQGRTNKAPDACYAFWVGASIEMLGGHGLVDFGSLAEFVVSCESRFGGVAKWPDYYPDPLHAALGIVGFSFCRPDEFPRMSPMLLLPEALVERVIPRAK
ncbi:geranylgeranyl transferase type-1 subunit beta [Dipsacomyces acuminosporus]|nr:geranylgeranyl transferase type-1 subunit beta [Dipsacomyces acuminosporus]